MIDKVKIQTNLLDDEVYTNLNHLFDYRNFSAHTAVNSNFELIAPSKETVFAHIKNIIGSILVKPPIFIKNVFDMLTEEIRLKKDIYINDGNFLENYLVNKYYSHMSDTMLGKILKSLWSIVFRVNNDECNENRDINLKALIALFNYYTKLNMQETLRKHISEQNNYLTVSTDESCVKYLVYLLTEFPDLFGSLNTDTQKQVKKFINSNPNAKALSWYYFDTINVHYNWLNE